MAQKILIFNYFLQKLAEAVQKQLGIDDVKAAFLAIIFSRANIFRRCISGGTSQVIWSCHPHYAEDLFWAILLDAKAHGEDLLKYYQPKASFMFGGEKQWGAPILEDVDIQKQFESIYPSATVETQLYAKIINKEDLPEISQSKTVNLSKIELPEANADTAAIDRALERLLKEKEFVKLLEIEGKYDFYGRSLAHKYYALHYAAAIPAV